MAAPMDEAAVMGTGAPRSAAVAAYDAQLAGRRRAVLLGRLVVGVLFFAFWEYSSGTLVDPLFISKPSLVGLRLWRWLTTGTMVREIRFQSSLSVTGTTGCTLSR